MLRFKLDENLPQRVKPALLALGHDVETVLSEGMAGDADPKIIGACVAERRILITLDLDFSDIRIYPPRTHAGIWVLRPALQTFDQILELALTGVKLSSTERTAGQLWVIDKSRVRIRD